MLLIRKGVCKQGARNRRGEDQKGKVRRARSSQGDERGEVTMMREVERGEEEGRLDET